MDTSEELRANLSAEETDTAEWQELLKAFRRRIHERFLKPISELARHDKKDVPPTRPGAAILALDCLLIDTIQSFREGRETTGEMSPARSFKSFLTHPRFSDFNSEDRSDFFGDVRNALLHNGETRKNWKFRIDKAQLLEKDKQTGTRTINRRFFHERVVREFRRLCSDLQVDVDTRKAFLLRMDALCGVPVPGLRNFYFAYGSNLLERELKRDADEAQSVGVAFLPGYQLEFTKHSMSRNGDAASIREHAGRMVWGFVYRMNDADKKSLKQREEGYREISVRVWLKDGENFKVQPAFTFIGEQVCSSECGPSRAYLDLVLEGARGRELPETYIAEIHVSSILVSLNKN